MVARLAATLESEPGDVEGWIMLIRSQQPFGRGPCRAGARRRCQSQRSRQAGQPRECSEYRNRSTFRSIPPRFG
jgi:hypothetical protein